MQKTSKLLPDWMHLDNKSVNLVDPMKSKEYTSHREVFLHNIRGKRKSLLCL